LKPRLLVVSEHGRSVVERLFARRGFVVISAPSSRAELLDPPPELVVLDFASPDASRLLVHFIGLEPPPLLVGIDPTGDAAEFLDAAFVRPVDPARLFVRAVVLLGQRRDVNPHARAIPGVVAVVEGNELFERIKAALGQYISELNAGPILAQVVDGLGSSPAEVTAIEIEAAIASGRFGASLRGFIPEAVAAQVIEHIRLELR
jgi:hypothetical protein